MHRACPMKKTTTRILRNVFVGVKHYFRIFRALFAVAKHGNHGRSERELFLSHGKCPSIAGVESLAWETWCFLSF